MMLDSVVTTLTVISIISYVGSSVLLYRLLKNGGIERVGKIGVKSFSGTFTDNVFQVVLRYGPKQFAEYIKDSTTRRFHSWAFYSSRCLFVCILILMTIRVFV